MITIALIAGENDLAQLLAEAMLVDSFLGQQAEA